MNKVRIIVGCMLLMMATACEKKKEATETATSGHLEVALDQVFGPVFDQEKAIFEYLYPKAIINTNLQAQELAIRTFLKDSVRLILSSRKLTLSETNFLKSSNVFPKTYLFAQDALVFLIHKQEKDSVLSSKILETILKNQAASNRVLVVDKNNGSCIVSLNEFFSVSETSALYSADSINGVVDYVSSHPGAIGVVSSAWCSDTQSKRVKNMFSKVKLAAVTAADGKSYLPFQSEIADSLYPYRRSLYIISRETRMSLPNGFASFLLGEKGQRILLKAGLLPAVMPGREVKLSKKDVF